MEYHDISSTNYVEEEIRTNPQILQQLQTERALAEHFDVSRTTIRNALNNLELEGFLVSDDTNLKLNNVFQVNMLTMTSFTEELKNDTNKLQIKMLTNQVIKTPIKLKDFFGSQQKQLIKIVRQRFLQQEPLSYETTYLPYDKFSGLAKFNLNGYSLYQLLSEQYQVRPSYGREEITYQAADEEKSHYLKVAAGTPLYRIGSYNFDTDDHPLEHTDQFLLGNKFIYHLCAHNIFDYQEDDYQ